MHAHKLNSPLRAHVQILGLQAAQSGAVTADDERQQLVFIFQSQRDIRGFPQSSPDVTNLLHHIAVQLLLLSQLSFLTLFKLPFKLQQRLADARKSLADLRQLPLEEASVAGLSVQVVRRRPADALQQPRRVLRLQFGDDEVVPHDGVPLLGGLARMHVREFKQHLALLRVYRLIVVPVRDKEVMESAIGDLRLEGPGVDGRAQRERCD